MGAPFRLTPTMASRKAAALAFIRIYIAEHGGVSPCYDEIAAGIGSNKERVKGIVHRLTAEGLILRVPGKPRSITLPGDIEEATRRLRAAGYRVEVDIMGLGPLADPVTDTTLIMPPELDYLPPVGMGDERDAGTDGG